MKRTLISVLMALTLVAIFALPAMAAEQDVGASVTVNEVISATITDNGGTGLIFGNMAQSESDKAEAAQNGTGAVTIVVAAETNVNCDIEVKATDFTGAGTIAITNAKYGTTNVLGSATAFGAADTYYTLDSSTAGSAKTVEAYHWLSIPATQAAGSYSSTFTYYVGP